MVGILEAFLPSVAVGLLFYFVMRKIVRADRNERNAVAALEAQHDARLAEHRGQAVTELGDPVDEDTPKNS